MNCTRNQVRFGILALLGLLVSGVLSPRDDSNKSISMSATPFTAPAKADQEKESQLIEHFGKLPLSFEANQGQTDGQVKFLSRGSGYTLFLTSNEAVLALRQGKPRSYQGAERRTDTWPPKGDLPFKSNLTDAAFPGLLKLQAASELKTKSALPSRDTRPTVLRMRLMGANPTAKVIGIEGLSGRNNYFIGKNPRKWRTNVPTYAKVRYKDVYPGVDLVYYGSQRQLEYDFAVTPGADPRTIELRFEGSDRVSVNADGELLLNANGGELRFRKPLVYQRTIDHGVHVTDGSIMHFLDGRYVLKGENRVGFKLAAYDRSKLLIIDPVLSYASYLGGSGDETGSGTSIAVDSFGNAYVAGTTASIDFPVTEAGYQKKFGGESPGCTSLNGFACGDAFVTKINATGTALVYSTYLGGSSDDDAYGIALDSSGSAYISGYTASTDFPTTPGAFQTAFGGTTGGCNQFVPCGDAFVAKLDPTGSKLIYSTYLGGSGWDYSEGVAVDAFGNAYVTGNTGSANFPTTPGAFQTAYTAGNTCFGANGGFRACTEAFVTKLNATGTGLLYSTYLGAFGSDDIGNDITVDHFGHAYVAGQTISTQFPTTPQAYEKTCKLDSSGICETDIFVTKLNAAGSGLLYSTYLGGTGFDTSYAVAVDGAGDAYLTGFTVSADFPTTPGAFQTTFGGSGPAFGGDVFVTKLNAAGSGLIYSTYLGGSDSEVAGGIKVDPVGNAYVTGWTFSTDFPTANPLQVANAGNGDLFVTKLNPAGSRLVYSTYLGGTNLDQGTSTIAIDRAGNAYVVGFTSSTDFPVTLRAFQPKFGGGNTDYVVLKISPVNAPGVSLTPQTLSFGSQPVGTTSPPQTVTLHNVGSAPLLIQSISTGPVGEFSETNTCEGMLGGGENCTITVTFTARQVGPAEGSVVIIDNATPAAQQIPLTGTGT